MVYTLTRIVPANTPVDGAVQYHFPVTGGLVYKVETYFPPGSSGLLGVIICDGGFQVWPTERGEWFFGDNTVVSFEDLYYINSPNRVLDVFAYNLDDTFDHRFQVRVGMASDPIAIASYLPSTVNADLAQSLADIIASQDQSYEAQRARAVQAAEESGET